MKLTKRQREVLDRMDREGACPTSKHSWGRYVSGATVAALERRGLVQAMPPTPGCPERMYGITNAGRAARKENDSE